MVQSELIALFLCHVVFDFMVAATGKLDAGDVLIVFRAVRLILLRTSDETSRLELSMVY